MMRKTTMKAITAGFDLVRFPNPLALGSGLGERTPKKQGFQLWRSFSQPKQSPGSQNGVYLESSMRGQPV